MKSFDEEDDGLGNYDDGVKRTLTDEQIAIFRHSELEALRRASNSRKTSLQPRSRPKSPPLSPSLCPVSDACPPQVTDPNDPGQISEDGELPSAGGPVKRKKKKNRRKPQQRSWLQPSGGEIVDLRKRTWDVVDKGLASLEYEDEVSGTSVPAGTVRRQQISYED